MSTPHFLALARSGELVITTGQDIDFKFGRAFVAPVPAYSPVYAYDQGVGLVLFRGHHDDSVWCMSTTGQHRALAGPCEGKWALGLAVIGPRLFRATWILPGRHVRRVVELDADLHLTTLPDAHVTGQALCLLTFDGETCTYGNGDGISDAVPVTRHGRTVLLNYPVEVNGRVVGHDGAPGAPNRTILADHDGFFVVAESTPGVQFPPQLDDAGNVALFENQYREYHETRTRPLAATPPLPNLGTPEPAPVPESPTPPAVPQAPVPAPGHAAFEAQLATLQGQLAEATQDLATAEAANLALQAELTAAVDRERKQSEAIKRMPSYLRSVVEFYLKGPA